MHLLASQSLDRVFFRRHFCWNRAAQQRQRDADGHKQQGVQRVELSHIGQLSHVVNDGVDRQSE